VLFVVICMSVAYGVLVVDGPAFNQYIENLRTKRISLRERLRALEKELLDIESKLKMAETVHEDYCKEFELPIPPIAVNPVLHKKFSAFSIKEMLIVIAFESGGVLDIAEARTILLKAGVFQNERNAVTSMSSVLSRHDDIFRRTGRGTYTLELKKLNDKERAVIGQSLPGLTDSVRTLLGDRSLPSSKITELLMGIGTLSGSPVDHEQYLERKQVVNDIEDSLVVEAVHKLRELDQSLDTERRAAKRKELNSYPVEVRLKAAQDFALKYGKKAPE